MKKGWTESLIMFLKVCFNYKFPKCGEVYFQKTLNGEPAVLVHYMALIGSHGIYWIIHCTCLCFRWLCNVPYHCYCLWRFIVIVYDVSISKPFWEKTCSTDQLVIKPINQVSSPSEFLAPHYLTGLQRTWILTKARLLVCQNIRWKSST